MLTAILVAFTSATLGQTTSVKPLFDGITDETSEDVFAARMNAVARIPHASAIEELIQYLARRGRTV